MVLSREVPSLFANLARRVWFAKICVDSEAVDVLGCRRIRIATDDHDRDAREPVVGAYKSDQLETIHQRQVQIGYQNRDRGIGSLKELEGLRRRKRHAHADVRNRQKRNLQCRRASLSILYDQNCATQRVPEFHDPMFARG